MTLGSDVPPSTSVSHSALSRRVSSFAMSIDDGSSDPGNAEVARPLQPKAQLSRQVSNEALSTVSSEDNDDENEKGRPASPVCCFSGFDKVVPGQGSLSEEEKVHSSDYNPLEDSGLYAQHKMALRIEADLQPMRLILSRLMANPTHNRKGIFNTPVDAEALKLVDYHKIITKPMDFGTIKARLHALAYTSRSEVADDIRLVFRNAMTFNPPQNLVHTSAVALLAFFEEQLHAFAPELCKDLPSASLKPAPQEVSVPSSVGSNSAPDEAPAAASLLQDQAIVRGPLSSTRTRLAGSGLDPSTKPTSHFSRKRRKRGTRVVAGHACKDCEGRICLVCGQGCLHLEPTLLICSGSNCAGAKIRRNATYYIAPDGSRQYCQRCYMGLPAVLPTTTHDDECRYKLNLLKRKNDEEVVERWITCTSCRKGLHAVCAMHNEYADNADTYTCPECHDHSVGGETLQHKSWSEDCHTFVSGSDLPVKLSEVYSGNAAAMDSYCAQSLPETDESRFIQLKIRELMSQNHVGNADKTVAVRVISDCSRYFKVPDVVRKHFQMATKEISSARVAPPAQVNYRSKAIALFQKIDGFDVCIFCMYVQEYDGDNVYEHPDDAERVVFSKRVYIAYLDSVEHFRPRSCRTEVFQEFLVSYLATARKRGYESAHIWACPPSRGNSFVFWNHPASQRTPNMERLVTWYHGALARGLSCGVVSDVRSLYETDFEHQLAPIISDSANALGLQMQCPPLLDSDFWIEEAVRIHALTAAKSLKARPEALAGADARCPAVEVAKMLRDKIIAHPSAAAFRRPVNVAAMKLADYHKIIATPMDLGTVYSRLILGEYDVLQDVVEDVSLVFANATTYNPQGHTVHRSAVSVREMFFSELDSLSSTWGEPETSSSSWKSFSAASMNLNFSFDTPQHPLPEAAESNTSPRVVETCLNLSCTDTIPKRMAGSDTWLLEKPSNVPCGNRGKRGGGRRKRSNSSSTEEPPSKKRRQSWLAEEVGASVRRNRMSFFSCSLKDTAHCDAFESYAQLYDHRSAFAHIPSRVADARHALLEFSQFRNLEFDTLRRAKYSSTILLYHLHHDDAPGIVPVCSSCKTEISGVRWHRNARVTELYHSRRSIGRRSRPPPPYKREELCSSCHHVHTLKDEFIPLPVSFQ